MAQVRACGEDLLHVVENEQHPRRPDHRDEALDDGASRAFQDTQSAGQSGENLARRAHGGQVDEEDPVGEAGIELVGELDGKPGLSRAAGPGDGEQTHPITHEQLCRRLQVDSAADDGLDVHGDRRSDVRCRHRWGHHQE